MYKSLAGCSTMSANRSARVVGRALLLVSLRCCCWELGAGNRGGREGKGEGGGEDGGCLGGDQARSRSTSSRAIRKACLLIWLIQRQLFFSFFSFPFFSPLLTTFTK